MKTLFLHYVCECRHQVKTALVFSPAEWPDSPHAFSSLFTPSPSPPTSSLCPAQRVEPAQHHQRNITSLSSQPQVNSD